MEKLEDLPNTTRGELRTVSRDTEVSSATVESRVKDTVCVTLSVSTRVTLTGMLPAKPWYPGLFLTRFSTTSALSRSWTNPGSI